MADHPNIVQLGLQRIKELGQAAMEAQHERTKWRPDKLTSMDETRLDINFKNALEEQFQWATAIEKLFEESE